MAVRARGGKWQADFMVAGTRYRETFDSEADAIRWEANAKASLMEGKPLPPARNGRAEGKTIATLGALLDYCEKNHWEKLKRSLAVSRINIKQVRTALGDNRLLSEITRSTADELVEFFLERGNTPGTINRKLGILGKALSIGAEIGLNVRHFKMPHLKPGGGRIRVIERHDEPRLLSYFERINPDMGAFTVLGLETGMRLGEMLMRSSGRPSRTTTRPCAWRRARRPHRTPGHPADAPRARRPGAPPRRPSGRRRPAHLGQGLHHAAGGRPGEALPGPLGPHAQRAEARRHRYPHHEAHLRNEADPGWSSRPRHHEVDGMVEPGMVGRYGKPNDEDLVRAMEKLEDRRPALRVVGGE
jgi:hypothetical protein